MPTDENVVHSAFIGIRIWCPWQETRSELNREVSAVQAVQYKLHMHQEKQ